MKEPAKRNAIIAGTPATALRRNLSRAGLVSLARAALDGLVHPKPRETLAEEVAEPRSKKARDSSGRRSAMDAGITGGVSLLGGSGGRSRRR